MIVTAIAGASVAGAAEGATRPVFSAPVLATPGPGAQEIAAADVSGDGKPDLVTWWGAFDELSVLVGNGDGSFRKRTTYRVSGASDIALSDVSGDGLPELIVVEALTDFGGDRWLESRVTVRINDGTGKFHREPVYTSPALEGGLAIAAGDVNGDGLVDVVVAGMWFRGVAVLLGAAGGGLVAPLNLPGGGGDDVSVADLNGDGRLDLTLGGHRDRSVGVRLGVGDGTFAPARAIRAPESISEVTTAELNGDRRLDLVVGLVRSDRVGVFLGNGDGTFGSHAHYAMTGTNASAVLVADFDGDAHADVVTPAEFSPIASRRGQGDGTLLGRQLLPSALAYSNAAADHTADGAVADFNQDGRPDLALTTAIHESTTTAVMLNWTGLPAPPCVVVPITREPWRRARRHLDHAGCRMGHVRHRYSARVSRGRVISQRPRHGAVLNSGAAVDVTVSRGRRSRRAAA